MRRALVGSWLWLWLGACATSPAPDPEPPAAPPSSAPAPSLAPPEPEPPAAATTPPAPTIEGYSPEIAQVLAQPSVWWLAAETRIALVQRGPVRLRPDGPDLGLGDAARFPSPKRLMVVHDDAWPRVVTDDDEVRLLLYVDRETARPVLLERAALRPTATTVIDDPPRRGHVVLLPGAWVDVVARQGSSVEVSYRNPQAPPGPTWSGWLDATALGTTVTIPEDATPEDSRPVFVAKRATRILTRPGGKALGEVEEDGTTFAITPQPSHGYRLVEYQPPCEHDFLYVGFVRTRDLFQPNYGHGYGCGTGSDAIDEAWGDAESAPRVELAAGRFLLDPDVPKVVGCTLKPTTVADLGDGRLAVPTIWGPVPVRLAPDGFGDGCGA